MVDIKCLVCEESLQIPLYIDPADYDGQLVCHKCKSLLHVKFVGSKVKKYKVVEKKMERDIKIITGVPRPPSSEKAENEEKDLKES